MRVPISRGVEDITVERRKEGESEQEGHKDCSMATGVGCCLRRLSVDPCIPLLAVECTHAQLQSQQIPCLRRSKYSNSVAKTIDIDASDIIHRL